MNERKLEFTLFCIEGVAEKLNIDGKKAYDLLSRDSKLIEEYIVPYYEALHTQSKEYIINDIIEVMKIKGVI